MKIIDLLNKIANGEEVPEKIKYKNEIWEYYKDLTNYIRPGKPNTLFTMYYIHKILNEEAEIIGEEKDIEPLVYDEDCTNEWCIKELYEKVYELTKALNELRKEK